MAETPNLDYIKEIAGGNEAFEKKFLGILKMEFPEEKKAYVDFLNEGKLTECAKMVHKIKHKLGVLGLPQGYELAIKYEDGLKKGQIELKPDFDQVLEVVEAYILKIV